MSSGPPNHATDFGHPPSTAPPALGDLRRSAAYESNDPFSAVQQRLGGTRESYGHPRLGSGATTFATGVPTTNAVSGRTTAYTSPPPHTLAPPTALPTNVLGHPTSANPSNHLPPVGYMPSNAGYYNTSLVARPHMHLNSLPASSSASFGHPAMSMAPAMDPMAFFGATPSPSGLRLVAPEMLDTATRQANWARRVSASRTPKGKGKVRARGAANPTPTLGDIPILSATMLSCTVVVEFYPWVVRIIGWIFGAFIADSLRICFSTEHARGEKSGHLHIYKSPGRVSEPSGCFWRIPHTPQRRPLVPDCRPLGADPHENDIGTFPLLLRRP